MTNYRKTFQNKIFPELNSKKTHTVTNRFIFTKFRNCAEFRKSGIGQFCAKWLLRMIAQIVVFSRKTDAQRKNNFAFRSAKIAQKFCEWKPYLKYMTIPSWVNLLQFYSCKELYSINFVFAVSSFVYSPVPIFWKIIWKINIACHKY